MELNNYRLALAAAMTAGAFAFTATAAAPVSVIPAEGTQETLEDFSLVFEEGANVAWAVTGTENTPYFTLNGEAFAYPGPTSLGAEGNQLTIKMPYEFTAEGKYVLQIAQGSYTVDGVAGDACSFTWDVTGISLGVTVEPAVDKLTEIQNMKVTFNDAQSVTLAENLGTDNTPALYLITENGEERRGTFYYLSVAGNNLIMSMRDPITEPGEYVVKIPGTCYFTDGNEGKDLEFNYTVIAPSYPEIDLSVNPATNVVETLENIEITFGGVELVEWSKDMNSEIAPRMVDSEGNRVATFAKLGGLDNMLSLGLYSEFDVKGDYTVIIPEGSYKLLGQYHGMDGKEITLNFTILGLGGYSVEPAVNTLTEIQNVKITFNEAKEVTLAENLGTDNTPALYLKTENGEERRGSFYYLSVAGNNLIMSMRDPITEPGEYVVKVPGTCYFLDGNPGQDIEFFYTVIEPSYPEIDLSVNPATNVVETLENIEITFGGVELVEWSKDMNSEIAPRMVDSEGNRVATFAKLGGLDNMLSLGLYSEFDVKGDYTVIIPEGSYKLLGQYHGMDGKEIKLNFTVLGLGGYSVEPSVNTLTEIQNVKVTFNEAKEVTLAEDLGTENTPALYLVTENGQERRGSFYYLSVAGNNLIMSMRDPITEPGEYVVKVPGTCYFLDGNPGQDIEFFYTVIEPSYPEIELSVNPATDVVETLENIEITFGGVELVEWSKDMNSEIAPCMVDTEGNRVATFAKLGGNGNMLSLGLYSEFDVKGDYTVIIPEGSYKLLGQYHGMDGKEITLNFTVLGLTGFSVEPAVNTLTEIQNVKVTFNEAKEVTLAEELGTENTPALYLITEEGQERRGSFYYLSVAGNNLIMSMRDPITEPGEYLVKVPGTCYFLDGNPGQDIEFFYTVIEPSYPEIELSVEPATDVVETIQDIEITFGGVDLVEWSKDMNSETAPCMVDSEGNRVAIFTKLGGLDNMLSLGLYEEFAVKGEYTVIIPEGSYKLLGQYHGMDGKEITLNFTVLGLGGFSVEPAVDTLTEIQNVKVTFNEAKEVTLAEDLGTENTPALYIVTEEGAQERRGTFYYLSVAGNNLIMSMRDPITEPGEYVVKVPGTCYFLDGNPGQDIQFFYTVVEGQNPDTYTVTPAPGEVENISRITVAFGQAASAVWNADAIAENSALYPTITDGYSVNAQLTGLSAHENELYVESAYAEVWSEPAAYTVTIPAGSYSVDGVDGEEIIITYIVIGGQGVDAIFGEKKDMNVYDVNGRLVLRNADANAIKTLRGIFVIDGKKYILR